MLMKIVYWASTIIAAAMLGMALTYLTGSAQVVEGFKHVGYPQQLRLVLGVAKPAAGVVLLLPGLRLLKEWAYAGAAFAWSMAVIAHWQAGDGLESLFPLVLLIFLAVSYLTRPASRRLASPDVPAVRTAA
ncbi:MAG: DoxX-like family protein [Acidobacteria bacterium]|nr:MAG: DoxX-like family protein [Acidobacteriota bacterium]